MQVVGNSIKSAFIGIKKEIPIIKHEEKKAIQVNKIISEGSFGATLEENIET